MRYYANQLASQLQKSLAPFYLVFGEEPFQEQQCVDAIRAHAKQQGFDEVVKFAVLPGFDWQNVVAQYFSMSLFSARTLIEIDLNQQKPAANGAQVLKTLSEQINPDVVLVLKNLPAGQDVQRSAWFKALDGQGAFVPCYPLTGTHLRRWLDEQCQRLRLNLAAPAKNRLLEATEGNLLACHQELEKLSLLFGQTQIDEQTVLQGLLNQAKFDIFDLSAALLHGNAKQVCKIINKLASDNSEPMGLVWALQKEAQLLQDLQFGQREGKDWQTLCKQHNIWKNQQAPVQQAMQRLTNHDLEQILLALADFDRAFKQQAMVAPYQALLHIALLFCTRLPFALPFTEDSD